MPDAKLQRCGDRQATKKSIFVIASSPQEQDLEFDEFKRIVDGVVSEDSILGLVMAIQPTEPRKRLAMEDIFREVQATGRLWSFAVMLHPPYEDTGGSPDPNDVRRRLKALNVDLHVIDGLRFAHINATAVRDLTKMP